MHTMTMRIETKLRPYLSKQLTRPTTIILVVKTDILCSLFKTHLHCHRNSYESE